MPCLSQQAAEAHDVSPKSAKGNGRRASPRADRPPCNKERSPGLRETPSQRTPSGKEEDALQPAAFDELRPPEPRVEEPAAAVEGGGAGEALVADIGASARDSTSEAAAPEAISPLPLRPPAERPAGERPAGDEVETGEQVLPEALVEAAGDREGEREENGDPAGPPNDNGTERTSCHAVPIPSPKEQTAGGRLGGGVDNEKGKTRKGSAALAASEEGSDEGSTGKGTVQGSLARREDAEPKAQVTREAGAGADETGEGGESKASVPAEREAEKTKATSEKPALEVRVVVLQQ